MFSKDLLQFLDWLEATGQPFGFEYLKTLLEPQPHEVWANNDTTETGQLVSCG